MLARYFAAALALLNVISCAGATFRDDSHYVTLGPLPSLKGLKKLQGYNGPRLPLAPIASAKSRNRGWLKANRRPSVAAVSHRRMGLQRSETAATDF